MGEATQSRSKYMMFRFVAFPSATKRTPLYLQCLGEEKANWKIISGPTDSGLYIIEATESAINTLIEIYSPFYVFIQDFE